MPPKLNFDLSGRLREFRLQKVVSRPSHSVFLGPAIELLRAVIPKNNPTAAETTYENRIVTLEQKSRLFFDDLLDEIVFINLPSMALAHDQSQPRGASHSIVRFAIPFLKNITEPKFVVDSFQEGLLFSTSFLKNSYVTRDDFLLNQPLQGQPVRLAVVSLRVGMSCVDDEVDEVS
jgi:hypothetical protein